MLPRVWLIISVAAVSQFLAAFAFDTAPYARTEVLHEDMQIWWSIDGHVLRLGVEANTKGWVGFGIAEAGGMKGADIVYYEAANNKLTDAYALSEGMPSPDACQDWTLISGGLNSGRIFFEASRPVETDDEQDWPVFNDAHTFLGTRVIAAWGESEEISYHGHGQRQAMVIRFHGTQLHEADDPLKHIKDDPTVAHFDVAIEGFHLPPVGTCYHASTFAPHLVGHEKYHLIAFEPRIQRGNEKFVHHMNLMAVKPRVELPGSHHHRRDEHHQWSACKDFYSLSDGPLLYPWTVGGKELILPADTGLAYPLPHNQYVLEIQMHYNNPAEEQSVVDSSGVRVYYTKKLRKHDVGIFMSGAGGPIADHKAISAGLTQHGFRCHGTTPQFQVDKVHVFFRLFHMHLHGERMQTVVKDKQGNVTRKDSVEVWDAKMTGGHYPLSMGEGFTLHKGDVLESHCYFRSDTGSRWGASASQEMCLDIIFYYPAQPLDSDMCVVQSGATYLGEQQVSEVELHRQFGTPCEDSDG